MSRSTHYQHHVFICTNQRDGGRACCAGAGAAAALQHAKTRVRTLGLQGPGQVQVSGSGCMNRCAEGPTMVIYPEGTWYAYRNADDIDEIIDCHLLRGIRVDRLAL